MKAVRWVGWALMGTGLLIFLFLGYQLVGTNLIAGMAQKEAVADLEARFTQVRGFVGEQSPLVSIAPRATDNAPAGEAPAEAAHALPLLNAEPAPAAGEPLGRIRMPAISLDWIMFEGVDRDTLKRGPGHMPWTPLPGQPGNSVVSGHRTTYGAPFFRLDELASGDLITVETVLGDHVYEVRETLIVEPTDVWVTDSRPGAWLTLTTCHPRFSARQRLIIFAELVEGPNYDYAQAAKDDLVKLVGS